MCSVSDTRGCLSTGGNPVEISLKRGFNKMYAVATFDILKDYLDCLSNPQKAQLLADELNVSPYVWNCVNLAFEYSREYQGVMIIRYSLLDESVLNPVRTFENGTRFIVVANTWETKC